MRSPVVPDRAITAEQWALLDDTVPASFLNVLLKEYGDVDLALATQGPLTSTLAPWRASSRQC